MMTMMTTMHELFIDATSHLYKRVCPSVGRSVGLSVCRSRFRQNSWKSRISSRISTPTNKKRWEMIHQPCNAQKTSQIIIIHAWGHIVGQLALFLETWDGRTDGPMNGPTILHNQQFAWVTYLGQIYRYLSFLQKHYRLTDWRTDESTGRRTIRPTDEHTLL